MAPTGRGYAPAMLATSNLPLRLAALLLAAALTTLGAAAQDTAELLQDAQALLDDGEYLAAEEAFTEVIEIEDSAEARLGRGRAVFWDDGREEESLPDFERALELDPTNVGALQERYALRDFLGKSSRGRREMLKHLEEHELDETQYFELCDWAFYIDSTALERRLIASAIDTHGERPALLALRGRERHIADDMAGARRDLEAATAAEEFPDWSWSYLSEAQLFEGDVEAALESAKRAVEATPEDGYAYFMRGRALHQTGDRLAALKDLRKAKELNPAFEGWSYEDDPDFDASEAELLWELYGPALIFLLVFGSIFGIIAFLSGGVKEGKRPAPTRRKGTQPRYDGDWKELLGIYLRNVVLTLLTLGIYRFWAKVRTRRFHYQHTSFAAGFPIAPPEGFEPVEGSAPETELVEGRFDYHATGKEKFIGFLKGMVILGPVLVGLFFLDENVTEANGPEFSGMALAYGMFFVLYLLRPLILVGSQRFNLARTSWNNLRMRFTGKVGDAYKLYARDLPLILLTFGIYWNWHVVRVRAFRMKHTKLGEAGFSFHGTGRELFGINVLGTMLTYMTLGLYGPWYFARRHQFWVNGTRFMGKRWKTDISGKRVFGVAWTGFLATIVTFGIALPWAITRWKLMIAHSTYYADQVDGDQLAAIEDEAANSTIEGIGEAGEIFGEIGDLFGI